MRTLKITIRQMCLMAWLTALLPCVEVSTVVTRVIDGDTIDTPVGKVRLLYIDTPESKSNTHGTQMAEGSAAFAFLSTALPAGTPILLWGPDESIRTDPYKRLLAVILQKKDTELININRTLIAAGWSPYWRKYGDAQEPMHGEFQTAHTQAETTKAGAWATAPAYMRDKTNERTGKK